MIHYQIKKYIDNGEENSLQIEIILNDSFNNSIKDRSDWKNNCLNIGTL